MKERDVYVRIESTMIRGVQAYSHTTVCMQSGPRFAPSFPLALCSIPFSVLLCEHSLCYVQPHFVRPELFPTDTLESMSRESFDERMESMRDDIYHPMAGIHSEEDWQELKDMYGSLLTFFCVCMGSVLVVGCCSARSHFLCY